MPTAVALRDGSTAVIRPLEPGEQDVVREIWDGLSDRSKRLRFLSPATELSPEDLDYLTQVDHNRHEAVVAEDEASGRPLGIARYVRVPGDPDSAEAAVVVIDERHNRGVGTALLEELNDRARANGIRRYNVIVSEDNEVVLRGLERADAERRGRTDEGEVEFVFELPREGVGDRLGAALRAAATEPIDFLAAVVRRLPIWRSE